MKVKTFEIINHGWEHEQYFLGCSGSGFATAYDHRVVGVGTNAKEAYEDAVKEIIASGFDASVLPSRPRGIRARDKVPADLLKGEIPRHWWYVSICFTVSE